MFLLPGRWRLLWRGAVPVGGDGLFLFVVMQTGLGGGGDLIGDECMQGQGHAGLAGLG